MRQSSFGNLIPPYLHGQPTTTIVGHIPFEYGHPPNSAAMPPANNHFSEPRRPCEKVIVITRVDPQLIPVTRMFNNVAKSGLHSGVASTHSNTEWRKIVPPNTTSLRKPVSRLSQRDNSDVDPNLDPSLDSAYLDPDTIWASFIPSPPPPYTPTMALRASTLVPELDFATAGLSQDMPIPKIATIIACVVLGLVLGGAIVKEASRRKLIRKNYTVTDPPPFRFRIPKFPNVRGRLAKGIECLSWNMENGVEMATRAEFDDRTWGTPMHAKGITSEVETPIITRVCPDSPNARSYTVPWSVSSYRSSCPPALGTFITNLNEQTDQKMARAASMSVSMNQSVSRGRTQMLETINEEGIDLFIGQETDAAQDAELDPQYSKGEYLFTNSGPVSVDLTSAESISTIFTLTLAGMRSAGKRENALRGRARQGSDASRSTEDSSRTDTDSSSDGRSGISSNTSIATMGHDTDADEEGYAESDESKSEGDEVFELKRVTDSMEVKKGILLALAKGQTGEKLPEMPKLEVSRPTLYTTDSKPPPSSVSEGATEERYAEDGLLHLALIAKSSSCSLMSLDSSASGASINLDDFPSPPGSFLIPSITFTLSTDSGPITLLYQ